MIEHFCVGKVAIEGKIPPDLALQGIVDQLDTQIGVVFERPSAQASRCLKRRHAMA
jgi:hypothetical protein